MPELDKNHGGAAAHKISLDALIRAACEELGTSKVIIVADTGESSGSIIGVSDGCKGIECGMLAEALLIVGEE